LNLQLIEVDISIWTKRTPQQDEKSKKLLHKKTNILRVCLVIQIS
jgi:hypothetical protein